MSEYKGSINNEEVGKRIKEIRESNLEGDHECGA